MKYKLYKVAKITVCFLAAFSFSVNGGFFSGSPDFFQKAEASTLDLDFSKEGIIFSADLQYPRVIKGPDTYEMWYEDDDTFSHTISEDGLTWQEATLTNISDVHEPGIIYDFDEEIYKMWYESRGNSGEIGYATSDDGDTWTEEGMVVFQENDHPWEDDGRYAPSVIKDDGVYKMWYQSFSTIEVGDRRVNYATSDDGINWDNSYELGCVDFNGDDGANNMATGLGDPGDWDSSSLYSHTEIKNSDGEYWMFYAAEAGDGVYKIGYASSENGLNWDKHPGNPVLSEGEAGEWDDGGVFFPSVIEGEEEYMLWYRDDDGGQLGYATADRDNNNDDEEGGDDNRRGENYDRYKDYKEDFKSRENKQKYFQVRDIKKNNEKMFWEMRAIYLKHKFDSDAVFDSLDQRTKDFFSLYKKYHGFLKYREYKQKIN